MATLQSHVRINEAMYKIARPTLVPTGARQWGVSQRPSQRGDPGDLLHADWKVSGPQLHSVEETNGDEPGYLGVDYGYGVDTRWPGRAALGPLMNYVDLSTKDVTYTNSLVDEATAEADVDFYLDASPVAGSVLDIELVDGVGTTFAYVARGQWVTKVNLSDMSVVESTAFPEDVITLLKTRHPSGKIELTAGMARHPYWVMQSVSAAPNTDDWIENTGDAVAKIVRQAPDRVVGLYDRTVAGNVLSGAITMANPNWNTVATINDDFEFTGFALDGNQWVLMTDNGPYVLDPDEGQFYPLVPEIDRNSGNRVIANWYPLGVIFAHRFGTRFYRDGYGLSIGLEAYSNARNEIESYITAVAGSEKWLYLATGHDGVLSFNFLLAMRPEGDSRHPLGYAPYVLNMIGAVGITAPPAIDGSEYSGHLRYVGMVNGLRARPTLLVGTGNHLSWMTIGITADEIDDTSYRYTTYGIWYGTELRRHSHLIKDMEAIEVETAGCTAARSITLSCRVTSTAGTQTTVTLSGAVTGVNDVITSNGRARRLWVDGSSVPLTTASGLRIRPEAAFLTDSSSASPIMEGVLRIYYRVRPIMANEFTAFLELDASTPGATANEQATALLNLVDQSGPVAIKDAFGTSRYVKVVKVDVTEVQDKGTGAEQKPRPVQVARVQMIEWAAASGS